MTIYVVSKKIAIQSGVGADWYSRMSSQLCLLRGFLITAIEFHPWGNKNDIHYIQVNHTVSSQNFCSFCFLPFFLSFYLSKIAHLKIFCEIATYTSRLVSFDKGLDHSGAGSDSSGVFLGSQWERQLKFSAYASLLISWSLSKFELT